MAKEKGPDDEEEDTKHRCLRFLFHLGCLWIIFQRQKGGESSYWASLLILTWLRGGTHTLAASATLFHQQLPQHFTFLSTTHTCHNFSLCDTLAYSNTSTFHYLNIANVNQRASSLAKGEKIMQQVCLIYVTTIRIKNIVAFLQFNILCSECYLLYRVFYVSVLMGCYDPESYC